jgi:hypothetical protein
VEKGKVFFQFEVNCHTPLIILISFHFSSAEFKEGSQNMPILIDDVVENRRKAKIIKKEPDVKLEVIKVKLERKNESQNSEDDLDLEDDDFITPKVYLNTLPPLK